jgi:hypothetical protein
MSINIKKTDGNIIATVEDGEIDTDATSLALVGRQTSNYALSHAENYVHLLENFAHETAPNTPVVGQLWYDTVADVLKVYNNGLWTVVGSGGSGSDTTGGAAMVYAIAIPTHSTSVLAVLAGGEIVMIISPRDVANNHLPATVAIGGTTYAVAARFPAGLTAGTNLATDTDDFVYRGHTEVADQAHFAGGGDPLAATTYVDLGTKSILLSISGSTILAAFSKEIIPTGDLPVSITVNNTAMNLRAQFPYGLQVGLTFASGFGVFSDNGGGLSGYAKTESVSALQTATTSAIATAKSDIYTWVDANSAVAGKLTELTAAFVSKAGTSSFADAIDHLYTVANNGEAAAVDFTALKAEFKSVVDAGLGITSTSYADAIEKLSVSAKNGSASSSDVTALKSSLLRTGASSGAVYTDIATAVSNLWTAATQTTDGEGNTVAGWSLDLNSNGYITGLLALNAGENKSLFKVAADKFIVSDPGDTSATPMFEVVGGAAYIKGTRIQTGAITSTQVATTSGTTAMKYWSGSVLQVSFPSGSVPAGARCFIGLNMSGVQTGSDDDSYNMSIEKYALRGGYTYTDTYYNPDTGQYETYSNTVPAGYGWVPLTGQTAVFGITARRGSCQSFTFVDDNIDATQATGEIRYRVVKSARYQAGGNLLNATLTAMMGKK